MKTLFSIIVCAFFLFTSIYEDLLYPDTKIGEQVGWVGIIVFYSYFISSWTYSYYCKRKIRKALDKEAKEYNEEMRRYESAQRIEALKKQEKKVIHFRK